MEPFSEKTQENEILQKTHKYVTYPSLRSIKSMRRTVCQLFSEKSYVILQSFVWRRHACVPTVFAHPDMHGDRKSTKTSGFHYFDKNDLFLRELNYYMCINIFLLPEMFELMKIIRRELFFNQALPAEAYTTVLPRTVKIRKFIILYFENKDSKGCWKLLQRFISRSPSTWCREKLRWPHCFDIRAGHLHFEVM